MRPIPITPTRTLGLVSMFSTFIRKLLGDDDDERRAARKRKLLTLPEDVRLHASDRATKLATNKKEERFLMVTPGSNRNQLMF